MKKVQAIIRPDFLEDLEERISESDIGGMTVSAVHGCGKQNGWKEYYRGTEIAMNMQPKLCCEFVVEDSLVEEAIALIRGR